MFNDIEIIKLTKLDTIHLNTKLYKINCSLGGNGGSSFKYTNINESSDNIFVKFLISPRNEIEINKFKLEIKLLQHTQRNPVKTTPHLLDSKIDNSLPIMYYITEFINGKSLKEKISDMGILSLDDIIDLIHRCTSSICYISPYISHRDFHPGNIILLDDTPDWNTEMLRDKFVDPKVIITDFGNSIMPIAFSYEDEEVNQELIYQNVNRRIEGSFRSLPPEVFTNPINAFLNNPGCGESWAIGILFYKLLAKEDILNIDSISEYSKLVHTNELDIIIKNKLHKIKDKLNNNYILIHIIEKLLEVDSQKRIDPGLVASLLWDYRFGDLNKKSIDFQKKYISHERNYPPKRPDEYDCY